MVAMAFSSCHWRPGADGIEYADMQLIAEATFARNLSGHADLRAAARSAK
jgi:6-phosphogluconate dehydrogenase